MVKSICDNCSAKNCLWRAETGSLDPPVMDCEDYKKMVTNADKTDSVCENETCPVYKMLAENDRLKKKVARLERKIERMKEEQESNAAWEKDFRCGQVQGMW